MIGKYGLREFSIVPFSIGLLILGYYYLIYMHKEDFEEKVNQQTESVIEEEASKAGH